MARRVPIPFRSRALRGRVRSGLEEVLARPGRLRGLRVGLIANPTAVTPDLVHASLVLKDARAVKLVALFGPEHGIWADAQDLVEVGDSRDPATGLPVFSLYGKTRIPTAEMLDGVDALLFDVQDVGSRYYTFIYTMLYALEACARHRRLLVVLDRPNPLGGSVLEGNVLEPEYLSFVGLHPLPPRHAMTVGELAPLFRHERGLDADLRVVRMRGWRREMAFEETGLPWVMPSPNMPTVDTAWVYPGGCLVEGTNLSEGRGTTRPFELVGAPWLDPWRLARDLDSERLRGVRFRPTYFTPTFQKHAGRPCGGVQVHVTDRRRFAPYLTYLLLIFHARRQDPARFAWRDPPYEYEHVKRPIDILYGSEAFRRSAEQGLSPRRLAAGWKPGLDRFRRRRAPHLLY
ncbi:MAG: DUF1343 domain-containing protein [Acidobacteria bacterium]|nr:MAG: DUF1343 domain-containing protein [Acidobacteriota bacterium]PYQ23708.1 MAG: DUF1343 domain-containing protein [Acidobacteriota bacterium]